VRQVFAITWVGVRSFFAAMFPVALALDNEMILPG
jgi:hypothetical protein